MKSQEWFIDRTKSIVMNKLIVLFLFLGKACGAFGQGVGIGTTTPDPSAAVEVSSVTQGMLVPRMTTAQREMIANPATGLLVFDVTTNTFWFRESSGWMELVAKDEIEVHRNGPDMIYMGITDHVGIGTMSPTSKLQVRTFTDSYGISHTDGSIDLATWVGSAWGSAGTGGGIGTRSPHNLYLFAGEGVDQFMLTPFGNVGINLPNAENRLDVASSYFRTGVHPTNRPLYVTGDIGAGSNGIEFRHTNAAQGIGFGYNTIYASGNSEDQNLGLSARGAIGNLLFSTNAAERMRITGEGRIGIGTSAPSATVEITRGAAPFGALLIRGTSHHSHFNYGTPEDTYIRGGKSGADVYINDWPGLGHVGIGLSNATNKLDIQSGPGRTGSHATDRPLYITGPLHESSNGIEFRHDNGTQGIGFGFNTIYATGSIANQDLGLASRGAGILQFSTSGTERLRITGAGHVGIGTTAPNAPLQFSNGLANRKVVLWEGQNNDHQFFGFGINGSTLRYQVSQPNDNHIFYAGTSAETSNELMRIRGNGNVKVTGNLEIGYVHVSAGPVSIPGLSWGWATCDCPAGTVVISGGFQWTLNGGYITGSYPNTATSWYASAYNSDIVAHELYVYAICARLAN